MLFETDDQLLDDLIEASKLSCFRNHLTPCELNNFRDDTA